MALTAFLVGSVVILSVSISKSYGLGTVACKWNEYYDDNMDDCGPCREICDHMTITRTEEQCNDQCAEYLLSLTCTYKEYYDDVTNNCAPCSEICDHPEITSTADECSSACFLYLRSQSCQKDQYFDYEKSKSCASCVDLCSGKNASDVACNLRCSKFMESYPPGHIVGQSPQSQTDSDISGSSADSSPSTSHPGVILTVVLGGVLVLTCMAIFVGVFLYRRIQRQKYIKGRTEEGDAEENVGDDGVRRNIIFRGNNNNNSSRGSSSRGSSNRGSSNSSSPGGGDVRQIEMQDLLQTSVQEVNASSTHPFQSARVLNESARDNNSSAATAVSLPAQASAGPAIPPTSSSQLLPYPTSTSFSNAGGVVDSGNVWVMAERSHSNDHDVKYGIPECDPIAPSSAAFEQTRRTPPRSLD